MPLIRFAARRLVAVVAVAFAVLATLLSPLSPVTGAANAALTFYPAQAGPFTVNRDTIHMIEGSEAWHPVSLSGPGTGLRLEKVYGPSYFGVSSTPSTGEHYVYFSNPGHAVPAGDYWVTMRVRNNQGQQGEFEMRIWIAEPYEFAFDRVDLHWGQPIPAGTRLSVTGGHATAEEMEWEGGNMPPGVTLTRQGYLTGTPTQLGWSTPYINAYDGSRGLLEQIEFRVEPAPLRLVSGDLPRPVVGSLYTATLEVEGGYENFTWEAAGLPPGLVLIDNSDNTATVAGVALVPGSYEVTVSVADDAPGGYAQSLSKSMTVATTGCVALVVLCS